MKKDQKIYITEDDVRFRKPSDVSDGIESMVKGQEVIFVDGPWFRVVKDGKTGWVHADYISETSINSTSSTLRTLQFVIGSPNLFGDIITAEVRKVINDEFGGDRDKDYLNCTEYAQYRLKTKLGIDLNWPVKSGRHGGKWWKIFKDAGLYEILTEPQTNCVMCFTDGVSSDPEKNEVGHVAFVENVLPDGSVSISEANWPGQGRYNERVISKEKWQGQYKARFIQFIGL